MLFVTLDSSGLLRTLSSMLDGIFDCMIYLLCMLATFIMLVAFSVLTVLCVVTDNDRWKSYYA